jgi:polar amino acid transport system substrate-binding protein
VIRGALLLGSVLALALIGSVDAAAPPTTQVPGVLTVGVNLPSEGFQVGAAKGSTVVFAQGLEIDLARALAAKLRLRRAVFVQSRFDQLLSPGPKRFDMAVAQITVTKARRRALDFTVPYMRTDQGVLLAQTVDKAPHTIAALRPLRLCALAHSTGAALVRERIRPARPPRVIGNVPTLMLSLQTGRCQAVVYDAPSLGTLKARIPSRYGAFAGVIRTREQYGIALSKGSPLLRTVNAALKQLLAEGLVQSLQRKWLSANLQRLPVLK